MQALNVTLSLKMGGPEIAMLCQKVGPGSWSLPMPLFSSLCH
jgi:hypothetical protein